MKSYKLLYRKLPGELVARLAASYAPKELDTIFAGFMETRPVTLRVNRLKTNVRRVMEVFRSDNIKFERVLWYEDALVVKNRREKELENHPLYREGHIYLQSLSSMIPPLVVGPVPGAQILDLTAAPGSKSTQMAALMGNDGFILANELNQIRAERLKFNVERQGATSVEVRQGDGKWLDQKWRQYFDAVLLDAPCSGVGIILTDNPQTYRSWSTRLVNQLVKEQRKLMEAAFWALKPGGKLVYSTCTLLREENEANAAWLLERFGAALSLEKLDFNLTGAENLQRLQPLSPTQGNTLTVIPSGWYEGFFVAKFLKKRINITSF
jgi:NOL1/NOP2/sun family putative RNA methylase